MAVLEIEGTNSANLENAKIIKKHTTKCDVQRYVGTG